MCRLTANPARETATPACRRLEPCHRCRALSALAEDLAKPQTLAATAMEHRQKVRP
jgi:hypothetical protein